MLIDVARPEAWEELNDQVKLTLGLEPRYKVRCFHGLAQAVFELAQGTAQFMSHKKALGVISGQTSIFESLLPYFYKETYEVQTLSYLQLTNVPEWVESLKKDTNFVLYSEDHPVTGEVYPFVDDLDQLLNAKRILSLRVSHAAHLTRPIEVRPYTVRLCSYTPFVAVAVLGERFRSPSLLVQNMAWKAEDFLRDLLNAKNFHRVNPSLIEKFESEISAVAQPYFREQQSRLYDRAVCVFSDVSAEALAVNIAEKLQLSREECWQQMATTNLCYWSVVRMFQQWWHPTPSAETLRGLLIFSEEIINTKDFAKLVISSYEELKALQSWDV